MSVPRSSANADTLLQNVKRSVEKVSSYSDAPPWKARIATYLEKTPTTGSPMDRISFPKHTDIEYWSN